MNHATTQTAPMTVTIAEWLAVQKEIEALKREIAKLRERKMDFKWGVTATGTAFVFVFGLVLLLLIDNRDRIIRLEEGLNTLKTGQERILEMLEGDAQPAVYYPAIPQSPASTGGV